MNKTIQSTVSRLPRETALYETKGRKIVIFIYKFKVLNIFMEILTNVNRKKFEYKNWKGGNEILLEACIIIHLENYLKIWLKTRREFNKLARYKIYTETNSFCLYEQ